MSVLTTAIRAGSEPAEPTWDIAYLFPHQGTWSEAEYVRLNGNRLVEFSNGYIEVLAMPTSSHQFIVAFLYSTLLAFITPARLGRVLFAPLRVRLWEGKFREPDVVFLKTEHQSRIGEQFWNGADLVVEVVSDDDRRRDIDTKRHEYALAGIPEYWIVDPREQSVTVLRLDGDHYVVDNEGRVGQKAASLLLPGFVVEVEALFASGR